MAVLKLDQFQEVLLDLNSSVERQDASMAIASLSIHCPEDEGEGHQASLEGVLNEPKEDYEEAIINNDKMALTKLLKRDKEYLERELRTARSKSINVLKQARMTI